MAEAAASIKLIRHNKATKPTIVAIATGDIRVESVAQVIDRMNEQSSREAPEATEAFAPSSLYVKAISRAIGLKKELSVQAYHCVLVSTADMVMLRMMGVPIAGHLDYQAFLDAIAHPDLQTLDRARRMVGRGKNKTRADRFYVEALADLLTPLIG
jgi:hypothetical protein